MKLNHLSLEENDKLLASIHVSSVCVYVYRMFICSHVFKKTTIYNSFKWLNSIILDPLSNNALQSTCGKPIIVSNTSGQHLTVKFKGRERGEGLKKLKSNQCVGWVYFIFDNFIAMVFYLYFFQQNYPREKVRKCMHKYIFFSIYLQLLACCYP